MKNLVLSIFAVLLLAVVSTSCKDECCDCGSAGAGFSGEVCEDDLPSGFGGWDEYKDAAEAAGCDCD